MTKHDVIDEFSTALAGAGLILRGVPVMDGRLRRIPVQGDRHGQKSGAYVGHLDGRAAGHITNWKTGLHTNWKSATTNGTEPRTHPGPTPEAMARRAVTLAATRARRHARAARYAASLWESAAAAPADHPYLARKRVGAHGLRVSKAGRLLIPAFDIGGQLWSLTRIEPAGTKRYLSGSRIEGCHYPIGPVTAGRPVLIAEGFATAATLHEITGLPVMAAFDSGNLERVAVALRSRHPDTPIVVAGDNDHHLAARGLANIGQIKAQAAARAAHGAVVIPAFPTGDPGTDWNDLANTQGAAAVHAQLAACALLGACATA